MFAGLPWEKDGKLYNVAAAFQGGRLLGLVPKTCLPNYGDSMSCGILPGEIRRRTPSGWISGTAREGDYVPFGTKILFTCGELPGLAIAAEICEDVWVPDPPSIRHALAGATVIVNCSPRRDNWQGRIPGGADRRTVRPPGLRLCLRQCGRGESSQDLVFGGHNIIAETGRF